MRPLKDITGQKFGRLTVVGKDTPHKDGTTRWSVLCECGELSAATSQKLINGETQSCGCLARELSRSRARHGHARAGGHTRTYRAWCNMHDRCYNPKYIRYAKYGGRGIVVCARWHSFENFLVDMGEAPEGLTLERREVNEGYHPGNCVWDTWEAQSNNRRNVPRLVIDGELRSRAQTARHLRITWQQAAELFKRLAEQGDQLEDTMKGSR